MIRGRARTVARVGSALSACVIAAAAVWVLGRAHEPSSKRPASPKALAPLLARCDDAPRVESAGGRTRTRCTSRRHPAFMLHVDAKGDAIDRAGLMVPIAPSDPAPAEGIRVGFEMFSLLAGAPAESFLPPEQLGDVGVRKTRFVRDGRVYTTEPMGNVGLVFSVTPDR